MDIARVKRILRRVDDMQYIQYGIQRIKDALFIRQYILLLERYHKGRVFDFTAVRDKRRKSIVLYAYKNSKYYRRVFDSYGLKIDEILHDWYRIPFLDKEIIRNEDQNMLAVSTSNDYVGNFSTGGSTGQPLGFFTLSGFDAEHQEFLFKIMGYMPGDKILAMDGTIIDHALLKQNIFWAKKANHDLPYGGMALSSQYLDSKNITCYIDFLNDYKPDIIRGYPSFISDIANYILSNGIKLTFRIKGIELTSESFHNFQVKNIKRAFKTKVFSQYGHAEASIFGYTLDDSMLTYCSPLYGYTEIIGNDGAQVKTGEIGEVVVTGFFNYAMPFIRYRTGDLALYDGEENGIVRLKEIVGRTQDYIYTKTMEKILLTAIVFARHYSAFQRIERWQIVQNVPGEICFRIVRHGSFSAEDQSELRNNFHSIAGIKTDFEFVETIPLTPRGKSKFLIQNIFVEA